MQYNIPKAPVVLRQLEKATGEEIMQKGFQEYLRTYSFKNAEWPDLITILDRICSEDINEWNNQWINQKGRPVLDVSYEHK